MANCMDWAEVPREDKATYSLMVSSIAKTEDGPSIPLPLDCHV
jgi:hypothetical protein